MFGMGTGGSSLLSSPDGVFACKYATFRSDIYSLENISIIPSKLNNASHSDFMWSFLSLFLRFLEPAD